ncbi:MAG: glycosyltransferase family 2 protein [Candidatus Rokubacteria bacterium]|nr:glycosyltransferase family 2 protein [Candidatus Rokubacteria bacterium]
MLPTLGVSIPCYNEAESLPGLVARFAEVRPRDLHLDLVLVNNGSTDRSAAVLAEVVEREQFRTFCRVTTVPHNEGYGHGIWMGLKATNAEYLGWSHGDLQTDPADVFRAFAKLRSMPDHRGVLVKGARQRRDVGGALLTYGMQTMAQLILRQPLRDINAQPKVFHRSLLAYVVAPPKDLSFDLYVLYVALRAGWKIETVPVSFERRRHGQSKWAVGVRSRWRHISAAVRYMIRLRSESA